MIRRLLDRLRGPEHLWRCTACGARTTTRDDRRAAIAHARYCTWSIR